jgi:hypothetical protein
MAGMAGHPPSLGSLCFAAAMITSNGWLDVLLYTFTRRIMIFSDIPPPDDAGIDTFNMLWYSSNKRFGAATVIEATGGESHDHSRGGSHSGSTDELFRVGTKDIKLVTTTQVVHEAAEQADFDELAGDAQRFRPLTPGKRYSEDSANLSPLARISD